MYPNEKKTPPEKMETIEAVSTYPQFFSRNSVRLRIAVLLCGAMTAQNLMRNTLSMSIVCMINSTWIAEQTQLESLFGNDSVLMITNVTQTASSQCSMNQAKTPNVLNGYVQWTKSEQAMMFAVVYWTGLISGTMSGWLSDRYGPKRVLMFATILHIISTLLEPLAADYVHHYFSVGLRAILGFGFGIGIPAMNGMIAKWFPASEKSTAVAIATTGNQLGPLLAYPIGSFLCPMTNVLGGWPLTFYVAGISGVVWCIIFGYYASNSPLKHRSISESEVKYLAPDVKSMHHESRKKATDATPWCALLTSLPVWSLVLMNMSTALFVQTLGSYTPTYFESALNVGIVENGLVSAIPFFTQVFAKFIATVSADRLNRSKLLSHTTVVKLFNSIGTFGSAIMLFALAGGSCFHYMAAISLLCGATSLAAFDAAGFRTSLVTIAPAYAGTVTSFTRISANLGAIVGPIVVAMVTKEGSQSEWGIVFLIMASMLTFSGIFFLIFGAAEVQSWALPPAKTAVVSPVVSQVNMFYASPPLKSITPTFSQTTVVSMVDNDDLYGDKPSSEQERAFTRF